MANRLTKLKWAFFLLLLCLGGRVTAQTVQYGQVKEMNSGGKALPGVFITIPTVHDCQPTASDANGVFRLNFGEHHIGDVVVGLKAKKHGYELVNRHVVREGFTLTDKDSLRVIMAPAGKIQEARMRYYDLLEEASLNRYDTTMAFFNQQYAQKLITEPELNYWKKQAEAELKTAYQHLDDYADRLACVNMDDLSAEALPLYGKLLNGDMEGALPLVVDDSESNVMGTYLAFTGAYPMENPEVHVANGLYDLLNIPDSLYSDVMALDNYNLQYENDFAVSGARYAQSCTYLGLLFRKIDDDILADFCFRKAMKMYELLEEMEIGYFKEQIDELKGLLESDK